MTYLSLLCRYKWPMRHKSRLVKASKGWADLPRRFWGWLSWEMWESVCLLLPFHYLEMWVAWLEPRLTPYDHKVKSICKLCTKTVREGERERERERERIRLSFRWPWNYHYPPKLVTFCIAYLSKQTKFIPAKPSGFFYHWNCFMQPNLFLCNTLRKAKYHYRHFLNFKQILSKSIENFCSHKNLNINVYNSFIYNCQNLEATGMSSMCGWISNLWSVQTMGYYLAPKSNELSSQEKTGDEMHNSKRKMPIWKSCILYGTDHVTFWKSQKHGDKKRCVAVRSQGKGRDEYKEHRGLLGQRNYSAQYYSGGQGHRTFVHIHRMHNTDREPWHKLWTLGDEVSMLVHWRRSGGMLLMQEPIYYVWGQGTQEKPLYLPSILLQTSSCSKEN